MVLPSISVRSLDSKNFVRRTEALGKYHGTVAKYNIEGSTMVVAGLAIKDGDSVQEKNLRLNSDPGPHDLIVVTDTNATTPPERY